jgi:acyl-coenzyme A thioesterase PaaI-like protein
MHTAASLLRAGVQTHDGALALTLDPRFQGLPDTAHGGSVLAALDLLADVPGSREIVGFYRRRVPLGTPLALRVTRADVFRYALVNESGVLVDGHVEASATAPALVVSPLDGGTPLPVSRTCFACGTENAIGLRVRLAHDDATVHGAFVPDERFHDDNGAVSSVAITTLLDEAAFWLGALATGESGMTTELRVTVRRSARAREPLTVVGRRAEVMQRPDDERYWITRVAAIDANRNVIAFGTITFVVVRGAARRLVAGLHATNPAEVLHAVFPRHLGTA